MNVITDLENDFIKAEKWLVGEFAVLKGKIAPIVVEAVEAVKTAEASGIVSAIATALSPITKGLSVEVNDAIIAGIPGALSFALGIEGLPANATPAQILAWEQSVLTAVGGQPLAIAGTWESVFGASLYGIIQTAIASNAGTANAGTLTLAQCMSIVEQAFQAYTAAKAAGTSATLPESN